MSANTSGDPKAVQRPHPPMWVACSRRETIHLAARNGLGALTFSFLDPDQAEVGRGVLRHHQIGRMQADRPSRQSEYRDRHRHVLPSRGGRSAPPRARRVPLLRLLARLLRALRRASTGRADLWERFPQVKDQLPDNAGRGGIGTPDQLRAHLARYEKAGIDQVMFIQQSGGNRHEHICQSLEVFAEHVMPEFKERDAVREAEKRRELAPYIEAALARSPDGSARRCRDPARRSLWAQGALPAPQFRSRRDHPDPDPRPSRPAQNPHRIGNPPGRFPGSPLYGLAGCPRPRRFDWPCRCSRRSQVPEIRVEERNKLTA